MCLCRCYNTAVLFMYTCAVLRIEIYYKSIHLKSMHLSICYFFSFGAEAGQQTIYLSQLEHGSFTPICTLPNKKNEECPTSHNRIFDV